MFQAVSIRHEDVAEFSGVETKESIQLRSANSLILGATIALLGLGIVMIYSTSGVLAHRFGSETFFLQKQLVWASVAAMALLVARFLDYHALLRLRKPLLVFTGVLLLLVLLPGVGTKLNGARRWFRFGPIGFQPSDIAKITICIYLAGFLAEKKNELGSFKTGFLPPVLVLGGIVLLIAMEPDIGTSALIATTGGTILFLGGMRLRHAIPVVLAALPIGAAIVLSRLDYVRKRFAVFFDPSIDPNGVGYHQRQSLIALSSGGIFGQGAGCSTQKLFYLPEAHTDFILAVIGEELGLIGTITVLGAFCCIVLGAIKIALNTSDRAGALLAAGTGTWIGLQAAFNIAVVTASIPPKGIPLPLVSYGGSALVMTAFAIGLLLNIAGHGYAEPRRGFFGANTGGIDV